MAIILLAGDLIRAAKQLAAVGTDCVATANFRSRGYLIGDWTYTAFNECTLTCSPLKGYSIDDIELMMRYIHIISFCVAVDCIPPLILLIKDE